MIIIKMPFKTMDNKVFLNQSIPNLTIIKIGLLAPFSLNSIFGTIIIDCIQVWDAINAAFILS